MNLTYARYDVRKEEVVHEVPVVQHELELWHTFPTNLMSL